MKTSEKKKIVSKVSIESAVRCYKDFCEENGVPDSRRALVSCIARSVFYDILRQADYSLTHIAKAFGKTHATVLHSLKKVQDYEFCKYDKYLQIKKDIYERYFIVRETEDSIFIFSKDGFMGGPEYEAYKAYIMSMSASMMDNVKEAQKMIDATSEACKKIISKDYISKADWKELLNHFYMAAMYLENVHKNIMA